MANVRGSTAMDPPGLTPDLALDFLNSGASAWTHGVDPLQTPRALVLWLRNRRDPESGQPDRAISAPDARLLHDEARRLRSAVAALVEAHHGRRALPEWALFGVNRVLAAAPWSWRMLDTPDRVVLEAVPHAGRPLALLAPVALAAARLVSSVPAERLRPCASPRCGAWFVDTSKGGQRRWCSMARCGNREKAATHRAKVARG